MTYGHHALQILSNFFSPLHQLRLPAYGLLVLHYGGVMYLVTNGFNCIFLNQMIVPN